jgi:hypothetical protein
MEGPVTVVYGIKWNCEGPFQGTDIERAEFRATGQNAVYVVQGDNSIEQSPSWESIKS